MLSGGQPTPQPRDRRHIPVLGDPHEYMMDHPTGGETPNHAGGGPAGYYQHPNMGDDPRNVQTPYGQDSTTTYRRVPFTPNDFNESMIGSVSHQQLHSTPRTGAHNNVIRVINKDMTAQFRGRAKSVPNAKIRWFENKKSQLLGCCLALAFLGMTIALYQYRWIGIIAGSMTTIICGSAVIITYHRKKHWHQHPNPIVHNRAILGVFFAICLLLNIAVDYEPGNETSKDNCRKLAGATEFFFFTSEAWGLVMASDLFFSLTSPFTSYKYLMRLYHVWVWLGGIIIAIIAGSIKEAGGFFAVDGQAIKYNSKSDLLVGFCLASSRVCCESKDKCGSDATLCEDSNFLTAQKWPWILIYSFVIVVVLVSVIVLTLAWHRLYLRGVPKTYNIRLRVLNYVSFFTGAYVFYWLLLLLMYMIAYFMATNSVTKKGISKGGSDEAIAQVLRQVVAFLIAAKGYLDYVIWFAVNSIEHRSGHGDDSADVDVDLSPQVNTALRSEILYYTTSGIKESVRAVTDELITIPISGEGEKGKHVKFWSFCPGAFRNIRLTYGISDAEYISLFGATTKEQFSEGRSGAFMFFTGDERLIVKTMSPEECNFLRKIAGNYESYMTQNRNTLLTRFYGCHAVSLYGKMYYFVVMANLFADTQVVHHRYDIKGSWVDRNAKVPKPGGKTICRYCNAAYTFGSTRNQECGDGMNFHEPNIVLKDNDLMMKIRIDARQAHKIYDQIHKDSDFLCDQGIMDYSLLMGVQSSEYFVDTTDVVTSRGVSSMNKNGSDESLFTQVATSVSGPSLYHFGIIDILQQWTFEKKMERFYKVNFKRKDPDGVSAMPPKPYKFRFQQRMSRIFGLGSQVRSNAPAFHLSHPALIDVLDQSDFTMTQRPGTFTSAEDQQRYPNGFVPTDQYGQPGEHHHEYRFA